MRIEKDGHQIKCIADWRNFAPPKNDNQWVEGRSAYELARAWCSSGVEAMPAAVRYILDSHQETRGLTVECVAPEQRIYFNKHGGEPRNADLAFIGHTLSAKAAVTIEAKADESFGGTIAETVAAAIERSLKNPKSKGVRRVEDLVRALFSPRTKNQPTLGGLRYQLLTATAGTLAYALQQEASLAVLVVHEFVTTKTLDARHAKNVSDYYAFLNRLSSSPLVISQQPTLLGPFVVPGGPLFERVPPLLIGKIVTQCCAICGSQIPDPGFSANYPGYICSNCDKSAVNERGDKPQHNSMADDGDNPVFIEGIKCWRRYRYGGYITMRDSADCDTLKEFYDRTQGPWS